MSQQDPQSPEEQPYLPALHPQDRERAAASAAGRPSPHGPGHSGHDDAATPTGSTARRTRPRRRRRRAAWTVVAALLVLVLLSALLVPWLLERTPGRAPAEPQPSVSRNTEPGLDGIIAEEVPPEQFQPGDCLTDISSLEEPATVLECDQPHEAQLIGRKQWPQQAEFPTGGMRAPAEEFCAGIPLNGTPEVPVRIDVTSPNESAWEQGDRRVDCIAHAQEGQLTESVITDPVVEPEPTDSASPSPSDS